MNVEVEQLVLQVLVRLAAVDDAFLATVDLEQEEHVVLIDFAAVVALHEFINSCLNLQHFIEKARLRGVVLVTGSLALDFSVNPLLLDEVALEESVVELDLGQALKVIESSTGELSQDALQEIGEQVMMVDEDLQEVLNPYNFLVAKLQVLVLLALELLTVGRVVDHGLDDAEGHVRDVLHRDGFVVILASLHG